MKIAFCGDSFCANIGNIPYPTYPYLVATQAASGGADIILTGIPGNPLYHSYMALLEVVDDADYIIFCISEPGRLPNKDCLPICYGSVSEFFPLIIHGEPWSEFFSIPESELTKVMKSARSYYADIMSHTFHYMAQKGILMQIDELMIQKQKKCIWFPCFETSMQGYIPKSGPTADTDLKELSKLELKWLSIQEQIDIETEDPRANHFNLRNNRCMFDIIINIINKDDFTPKVIKMKDYFKS
jgi:hypothetical protein